MSDVFKMFKKKMSATTSETRAAFIDYTKAMQDPAKKGFEIKIWETNFKAADTDSDHRLNFDEFKTMNTKAMKRLKDIYKFELTSSD